MGYNSSMVSVLGTGLECMVYTAQRRVKQSKDCRSQCKLDKGHQNQTRHKPPAVLENKRTIVGCWACSVMAGASNTLQLCGLFSAIPSTTARSHYRDDSDMKFTTLAKQVLLFHQSAFWTADTVIFFTKYLRPRDFVGFFVVVAFLVDVLKKYFGLDNW